MDAESLDTETNLDELDLEEIETALDEYASGAGVLPVTGYFIGGGTVDVKLPDGKHLYSDSSLEFCCDCADALID